MKKEKNKNETKKSYIKFLISKETQETQKKLQKMAIKEVKDINETEINSLTKQIANSENKIKTLIDIMQNLENPYYIQMLGEQFKTMEEIEQFMTKQIPQNMTIIQPSQGPKHLLIEDKMPILKTTKNIYTYISSSIDEIVKDTQFYWNSFRIEEVINLSNDPALNNEKMIIQKTKEHLQTLLKTHSLDLTQCVPPNSSKIQEVIQTTIKAYTGSFYQVINNASTSKDVVILRGIKYLFQILIKNYRQRLFGTPMQNHILLYRNITLPQDLFNLYKKNNIIYFTNLTSASKKNLTGFGGSGGNGLIKVTFLIKLLYFSEQKSNKFYSGLDVSDISYYKTQEQILIFPFQFFLITHITQKSAYAYQMNLQQIKSKAVIEKMQEPIKKNTKKCTFNKNHIKENIQKIHHKEKSIIQQKITMKKSSVEQFKSKILSITQKEYIITKVPNQPPSQISKTLPVVSSISSTDTSTKSQLMKTQSSSQQEKKNVIIQILKQEQKKQIDQKIIQQIKKKQQAVVFQNTVHQQKKKQKEKIEKIQNIAKQCQTLNQILSKLQENTQSIKETYNITKTEVQFKQQILINKVIDSVSKQQQNQSDKSLGNIAVKMKQNSINFNSLQVANNVQINHKEYLVLALQQAFKTINQKTIILSSLPSSLYKFYVERMTVGDINKFIYKFYFYASKPQKDIKDKIESLFKARFTKSGQYIKINIQAEDKLRIALIESSQSYQQIHKILNIVQENNFLNIIKGLSTVKYSNLIYCDQMLDKRGNNNYIIINYPMEKRGHQDYYFPNGSLRIGLKVWDVYEDNNWVTMNGSPGQWPVIYTSFGQVIINEGFYGLKNDNQVSAPYYPTISQQSINCCSDFNQLIKYLPKVQVNGENLYLGFQCRVDPKQLQYSNNNKKFCYIDRSKSKSIRPYGIILKKSA